MTATTLDEKKQQKLDTARLKKFAQSARRLLKEQVATKLEQVLAEGSLASRNNPKAVSDLKEALKKEPKKEVIERVAYTWFNRFSALRFMDLNGYTKILVVSPLEGQVQPETLAEAKGGFIDEELVSKKEIREKITGLLNGSITSNDAQSEAYSLLLVSVCNYYHSTMPYLFERIDDYTELLMPDDLLSGNSILAHTREALSTATCKDLNEEPIVEVIGWLYQYYISERKDEVFAALKKNKKIESADIPAATQLFTPNWIVRYLVENSLGRLWMLNKPNSKLKEQMPYYIASTQEEDFLKISSPEEIKVCDPACGSGHMLVYAFDLLYAIYEEEGYEPSEIPTKILQNNLYGIEIDERAGELAAFALTMKARAKYKRFFAKPVQPNICVLENIDFSEDDLGAYMNTVGRDLFTAPLLECLRQFKEAKNFGALIRPAVQDVKQVIEILEKKNVSQNVLLYQTHAKVLEALKQADYLSQRYHIVVANPPYMDMGNMNGALKMFIEFNYKETKQAMDASFILNCKNLTLNQGFFALITQRSWMFLSRLENFRLSFLSQYYLSSLLYLGTKTFPEIQGEKVQNAAFIFEKSGSDKRASFFYNLTNKSSEEKRKALLAQENLFKIDTNVLKDIPGFPISFWISDVLRDSFKQGNLLGNPSKTSIRVGLDTGDNDSFVKNWFEVNVNKIGFNSSSIADFQISGKKWVPHIKGGTFHKWYGNLEEILKFDNQNYNQLLTQGNKLPSRQYYFREGLSYTRVSSGKLSVRYSPVGTIFNSASPTIFPVKSLMSTIWGLLNSKVAPQILECLSPTLNFQAGELRKIPLPVHDIEEILNGVIQSLNNKAKFDWDSYETSWDFQTLPLISNKEVKQTLKENYTKLRMQWQSMTDEMKRLEEENNKIFIEAYGLEDELTPEVPLKEITLTCNPYYRYDDKKSPEQLEVLLKADTIREFISYAVGCMFGRYSLDKPGLILANQGDTLKDYLKQVPQPSFMSDEDNVIPVLDGNWFTDDIAERFGNFLKVSFGEDHYEENLTFIESAIGKDIRKYFIKDFYNDHIKYYKKRPIYWMFSSSKSSFNALVYMHRYRADTVSTILNGYLREYRSKLSTKINQLEAVETSSDSSPAAKTKALKDIEAMRKIIKELIEYEQEVLYPLATQKIELDLDDGVKVNYNKLGKALQNVTGLSE